MLLNPEQGEMADGEVRSEKVGSGGGSGRGSGSNTGSGRNTIGYNSIRNPIVKQMTKSIERLRYPSDAMAFENGE